MEGALLALAQQQSCAEEMSGSCRAHRRWCLWEGWGGEAAQEGCSWPRSAVPPLKDVHSTGHWGSCCTLLFLGLLSQEQSKSESGIQSTARKKPYINQKPLDLLGPKLYFQYSSRSFQLVLYTPLGLSLAQHQYHEDSSLPALLLLPSTAADTSQATWICWFIGGVWEQGEEKAWSLQKKKINRTWHLAVLAARR